MDARVITIRGNDYSERVAQRCIDSANIPITRFDAITPITVGDVMRRHRLHWTWGKGGAGLRHHNYGGSDTKRQACAMSHYLLWLRCAESDEPIFILEHDAVFVRDFEPFDFRAACMVNDPRGATPKGNWWHEKMAKRGPGIWPKTKVLDSPRPDGLAGGSAYLLQPATAAMLLQLCDLLGLWPNDAILCRQLVADLQEVYPYITEVRPERSTLR